MHWWYDVLIFQIDRKPLFSIQLGRQHMCSILIYVIILGFDILLQWSLTQGFLTAQPALWTVELTPFYWLNGGSSSMLWYSETYSRHIKSISTKCWIIWSSMDWPHPSLDVSIRMRVEHNGQLCGFLQISTSKWSDVLVLHVVKSGSDATVGT